MRKMTMMLTLSVVVLLVAATAQAAIVVTNGGFELPNLAAGGSQGVGNGGTLGNWTFAGAGDAAYLYTETTPNPDFAAADGDQYMLMRNIYADSKLYQGVGTIADTTENDITLNFSYSGRLNHGDSGFTIGLYDAATGGNALATFSHTNTDKDTWHSDSVTALDVTVGTTVYVRMTTAGGGSGKEMYFDALSVSAVPEPATMSLLGIGGLLALVRRRRK